MSELDANSILSALDDDQQQAATALRGPVAIIAGPGSGKTRTISHRIGYGIATGVYNPQRVLALTYTNRAAAELRLRLRQLGANVQVRTFHSAALSQLQYFWPQITGYSAPKLLTSKFAAVEESAAAIRLPLSKSDLLELISEIEFISYSQQNPEQYQSRILPARFMDLVAAYRAYKAERRLIDWEDALLLCTGMLRNEPRIMAQFEQQYRHFTVDEYQDISPLQQGLLETWLGEREEVCVVGDPRQTIYSFTGASSEFLLGFSNRFESASVFELNRNYRSSKEIVALANSILPSNPLIPVSDAAGQLRKITLASPDLEAEEVCRAIAKSSAPLSEIAILARTNNQLGIFEAKLEQLGIKFQVRGQGRFFAKPHIRQAIMAIRALAVGGQQQALLDQICQILLPLGWSGGPNKTEIGTELQWFISVFEELGNPSVDEFIREIDERERSGHEPVQQAVTLATVHGTKGLEWAEVYLVGVNDQLFPIVYAQSEAQLAEERRLFYVAITRAKNKLTLSSISAKPESPFVLGFSDSRS